MTETYRYLSVFSGIEAFSVAVSKLDFEAAAFAEIEDFPSKVLAYRYPNVPNLGDMTKIDTEKLGRIDWLVGGAPCQSFSVAGLRRGLSDDRGNLTLEYVRLAHELAERNGLRGLLFENVPGILNQSDNPFGCLLGALVGHDGPLAPGAKPRDGKSNDFWRWIAPKERVEILDDEGEGTGEFLEATEGYHRPRWPDIGMVAGPRARAAWRVLDSRYFGVAQRRRRVFLVVDFGNQFDPAAVLFEPRGKGRGFTPGGKARENVAGTISARTGGGGGLGTDMELGGGLQAVFSNGGMADYRSAENASTVRANGGDAGGGSENIVVYSGNAEGGNADLPSMNAPNGKKGVNNQTPLVSVFSHANGGAPPAVAFHHQASSHQSMNPSEVAPSLDKSKTPAVSMNGIENASTEKTDTFEALQLLRSEIGEIDFEVWGLGIASSLCPEEILQPNMRGGRLEAKADEANGGMDGGALSGQEDRAERAMRRLWESGRERRPPHRRKLSEQCAIKLGQALSELPHEKAQVSRALQDLRRASEGLGVLQSALPAIQRGQTGPQVRRLTPTECECLQGFPRDWTRIPGLSGWRALGDDEDAEELRAAGMEVKTNKKTGKSRVNDPDGPRYKALGNSFTVEPVNWIMARVQASLRGEPMPPWEPLRLWTKPPV